MEREYNKFLPIGTVVLLKGAVKELMITGFYLITPEQTVLPYDYCGCIYPEGTLNTNKTILFNHDQIEKIVFLGYQTDKQKELSERILKSINKEQ